MLIQRIAWMTHRPSPCPLSWGLFQWCHFPLTHPLITLPIPSDTYYKHLPSTSHVRRRSQWLHPPPTHPLNSLSLNTPPIPSQSTSPPTSHVRRRSQWFYPPPTHPLNSPSLNTPPIPSQSTPPPTSHVRRRSQWFHPLPVQKEDQQEGQGPGPGRGRRWGCRGQWIHWKAKTGCGGW